MKAAVMHMANQPRFKSLNDNPDNSALLVANIRKVLGDELPTFIKTEAKEAIESGLGEAWIKVLLNTQCNKWAIDALDMAQDQI